jgi:hypothetical protein
VGRLDEAGGGQSDGRVDGGRVGTELARPVGGGRLGARLAMLGGGWLKAGLARPVGGGRRGARLAMLGGGWLEAGLTRPVGGQSGGWVDGGRLGWAGGGQSDGRVGGGRLEAGLARPVGRESGGWVDMAGVARRLPKERTVVSGAAQLVVNQGMRSPESHGAGTEQDAVPHAGGMMFASMLTGRRFCCSPPRSSHALEFLTAPLTACPAA